MSNFHISFMEQNDIQKSAKMLSIAMQNNPHHIGVFLGNGENERQEIEKWILAQQRHTWKLIWMKMSVFMKNSDLKLFPSQTFSRLKIDIC